jgi:PPOX class probable F420-dependent enzyme
MTGWSPAKIGGPIVLGMLPESVKQLIAGGPLAHVTTLDRSGAPHVTLAWIGLEGDDVVFGTLADQAKLLNIRRDPRVTISFHTTTTNAFGLREYVVLQGRGRVVPGGAAALLQRLARIYLGPDVVFPPMANPPAGFVTHVVVERIGGVGPWR